MNFSPWLNLDNLILIHKAGQVVHLMVNYILSDGGLVVIVCHTSMAPNCKSFLSDTMSLASSISHASWDIDVPPIHIGTIKCPVLPTSPSLLWNILAQQYLPNTIQHPSTPLPQYPSFSQPWHNGTVHVWYAAFARGKAFHDAQLTG